MRQRDEVEAVAGRVLAEVVGEKETQASERGDTEQGDTGAVGDNG